LKLKCTYSVRRVDDSLCADNDFACVISHRYILHTQAKIEMMESETKETRGVQWQVLYDGDRLKYCRELFAKSSRVTQT